MEFHDETTMSGPQTDNYSYKRLRQAKKLLKESSLPSIEELISFNRNDERSTPKNKKAIHAAGGFLVRFLYEYHPDEFRNYIKSLAQKGVKANRSHRLNTFKKSLGSSKDMQIEFDVYMQNLIKEMNTAIKNKKS